MRRPRPLLLLVPVLLAGLLLGAPPAAPAAGRSLVAALDARLRDVPASRLGVAILRRGPRPAVVYVRGHNAALVPASTAKIFTAAAVLDLLGPCHTFGTTLTARGGVEGGTLGGDLVLHGTGDPNLSGRFTGGDPMALLEDFAARVVAAGIRRVEGALVLDDGPFDRVWVHPSWSRADRQRWYGAPVGGLAFNDGCVDIVVEGRQAGQGGAIRLPSTAGPWSVVSKVKTAAAKAAPSVWATWGTGDPVLEVRGRIGAGQCYTFPFPVPDPARFLGGALLQALRHHGVAVRDGTRLAADPQDRLPGAVVLASQESPLAPTLDVMNRRSQNFYASLLFKGAGVALEGWGTWESGERAVGEMLRRRGLDPQGLTRIVDGSGLSLENRTTAATLARLLVAFDQDLVRGPLLYHSLAVPGEAGTLSRRLTGRTLLGRLHAKTGTLGRSGVHALAGYLDGTDGQPGYAFAVLSRGVPGARALIDDVVEELGRP